MYPTDAECVDILIAQLTGALEKAASEAGAALPVAFQEKARAAIDDLTAFKAEMAEAAVAEPSNVPSPPAAAPRVAAPPPRIEDPLAAIAHYRDAAKLTPAQSRNVVNRLLARLQLLETSPCGGDPPDDVEGLMEWALGSGSAATVVPLATNWRTSLRSTVRSLPVRRALWWSCLAAVHVMQQAGIATDAADWKNFEAAADWAMQPESSEVVHPLRPAPVGSAGDLVARALTKARAGGDGNLVADDLVRAVQIWLEQFVAENVQRDVAAEIFQFARDVAAGERLWPGGEAESAPSSWLSGLS